MVGAEIVVVKTAAVVVAEEEEEEAEERAEARAEVERGSWGGQAPQKRVLMLLLLQSE